MKYYSSFQKYVPFHLEMWSEQRLTKSSHIAFFISSHGLGHAARAAGIMAALHELNPGLHFEIFTAVPEWFFKDSLPGPFTIHSVLTDIGLVQKNPFNEDVPRSLKHLDSFFPFDSSRLEPVLKIVSDAACNVILCDIAPMGIEVGKTLGIPSVLIENFTWDWIYERYVIKDKRIKVHIDYLNRLFDSADFHIQTIPVCNPKHVDITVRPVSRKPRTLPEKVRSELGIPGIAPMVMITMGGIPQHFDIMETLRKHPEYYFVISGGGESFIRDNNVIVLPYHSDYYHPDLIHASNVVVGKSGYSTLAEVFYSGIPYIFVKRPTFRESEVFTPFIKKRMNGVGIPEEEFNTCSWLSFIPDLLKLQPIQRKQPHGGDQAAEYILGLLDNLCRND
ncbi:MAG TPA: hypothetical protein HPQ03_16015 [Deltaproteobacteria bacterium]|nr:hypothetical protein [Deltaproteobacteria bacterium]